MEDNRTEQFYINYRFLVGKMRGLTTDQQLQYPQFFEVIGNSYFKVI